MSERIEADRLALVPGTPELLAAERRDPAELARLLEAELPPDWPPEFHDSATIRYAADALSAPDSAGWWIHYFVDSSAAPARLVGVGGYKGPPGPDGMVEVGYSVVPSAQRRGFATEAVRAMATAARRRGAHRVRAETLPQLTPSIRVLEKAGFTPASAGEAGVIAFELDLGEEAQPSA